MQWIPSNIKFKYGISMFAPPNLMGFSHDDVCVTTNAIYGRVRLENMGLDLES